VAEYEKTIPPGGSGTIKATVKTTGGAGLISRGIALKSNSVENAGVSLTCRGYVAKPFEVLPSDRLLFNKIHYRRAREEKVTIRATDGKPFRIEKIETKSDYLLARAVPLDQKGNAYTLTVEVPPTAPIETRLNGIITVQTDHAKNSTIEVYYSGIVEGPIAVQPKWITIQNNRAGETGAVTLSATGESPFNLRNVNAPKGVRVRVTPQVKGKLYQVEVTLAEAVAQSRGLKLSITTNRREQRVISVPIVIATDASSPSPKLPGRAK
jgi:hypothetical protein